MPRHQHRATTINSRDKVLPPEPSNPTTAGPGKCNIAEDKDFTRAVINMYKDLKEDMNKSINEIWGTQTNSGTK